MALDPPIRVTHCRDPDVSGSVAGDDVARMVHAEVN
jgi:hypothetical protein